MRDILKVATGLLPFEDGRVLTTLTSHESAWWSQIRALSSEEYCKEVSETLYGHGRRVSKGVSMEVAAYINQASEFYENARSSPITTSPLMFYYAFLNLAKAVIELRNPKLSSRKSSFHHGLTRKSNNVQGTIIGDAVQINSSKGVFHELHQVTSSIPLSKISNCQIAITDLCASQLEIQIENEDVFKHQMQFAELIISTMWNQNSARMWLEFDIDSNALQMMNVSDDDIVRRCGSNGFAVRSLGRSIVPVPSAPQSGVSEISKFRQKNALVAATAKIAKEKGSKLASKLCSHVRSSANAPSLCLSLFPRNNILGSLSELETHFLMIFWFGSLVRYSPGKLRALLNSKYRAILEGQISQVTVKLLLLFDAILYRRITLFQ